LQSKRLEMGKQLGWLESDPKPGHLLALGNQGGGGGGAPLEEVNALKMRCLELESKLEHRELVRGVVVDDEVSVTFEASELFQATQE